MLLLQTAYSDLMDLPPSSTKGFSWIQIPPGKKNYTSASPLTTDWQPQRRGKPRQRDVLVHLFPLSFLYLSLDVGFCDDIPLMAARFLTVRLSIFIFIFFIFASRLYGKEWHETRVDGEELTTKERRNTRMSILFSILFWFVGFGGRERKSVQWDLLFRREIDSVW
jgi:hypothetical protein